MHSTRVRQGSSCMPELVVAGVDVDQLSAEVFGKGAEDYRIKGRVAAALLERAIRYAIERHRLLADVGSTALFDELTGLYNRRGLLTVAGPLFKMVGRLKKHMVLLFLDLDNLKAVNDTWGHKAGDLALMETADLLRQSFRESDMAARVGGDEFAVVAMGVSAESGELLVARLQEWVRVQNALGRHDWQLSLSVGLAYSDPDPPSSLEALLALAHALMYHQKPATH